MVTPVVPAPNVHHAYRVSWCAHSGKVLVVRYSVLKMTAKTIVYQEAFDPRREDLESATHKWFLSATLASQCGLDRVKMRSLELQRHLDELKESAERLAVCNFKIVEKSKTKENKNEPTF